MNLSLKHFWPVAVTALPFLALAGLIVKNEATLRLNTEYRVPITGYDPVDVLTGHYIQFRYVWPVETGTACLPGTPCRVCFTGDRAAPDINIGPDAPEDGSCAAILRLGANGSVPRHLTRYNIPEGRAADLDDKLRRSLGKFEAGLVITKDGDAQIKNVYLDGQPLEDR